MQKRYTAIAISLLALSGGYAMAGGPSAESLAFTCAGCHGTDGSSKGPATPHIAGLNEEYFVDMMNAYKADEANPTIMNRMAKAYTEEQFEAMAKYFSKQKLIPAKQPFDKERAKRGAKLHKKYCEKCHEEGGREPSDGGTLAGQWIPYLQFSLADFRAGHREMPKKMKRKVDSLLKKKGDDALMDLIHFYASQQ